MMDDLTYVTYVYVYVYTYIISKRFTVWHFIYSSWLNYNLKVLFLKRQYKQSYKRRYRLEEDITKLTKTRLVPRIKNSYKSIKENPIKMDF